jgi:hypothetical protein
MAHPSIPAKGLPSDENTGKFPDFFVFLIDFLLGSANSLVMDTPGILYEHEITTYNEQTS